MESYRLETLQVARITRFIALVGIVLVQPAGKDFDFAGINHGRRSDHV
jgi:hypothetical protein